MSKTIEVVLIVQMSKLKMIVAIVVNCKMLNRNWIKYSKIPKKLNK